MSTATRQRLLAQFLHDEAFEARVRADPHAVATEHAAPIDFVCWLAALSPARVASFRKSRAHKDALRAGEPPTRIES